MEKRVIVAGQKSLMVYLKEVWKFRSLIITFAYRDLKVQYAQTFLGLLWSVVQPLTGLIIFTFFFGKLIKVDTGSIPYPLFAFSGITVWYYFSYLVGNAGTSLIQMREVIKNVSFPKIILPISKIFSGAADFLITLFLMFLVMIFTGNIPGTEIVALPLFMLLAGLTGFSAGIWLSALTIKYRDVHHIIPFIIGLGIWLTPVFYPATLIPLKYHDFLYLNPVAGIIEGFRWSLFGGSPPSIYYVGSYILVLIVAFSGIMNFNRMERKIVDWI